MYFSLIGTKYTIENLAHELTELTDSGLELY